MIGSNKEKKIFSDLALPTIKEEDWKNTNLADLNKYQWQLIFDERLSDDSQYKNFINNDDLSIVLVNGVLNKKYSNLKMLPKEICLDYFKSTDIKAKNQDNFLKNFNTLNFYKGLKIKIAANFVFEPTIHIINIYNGPEQSLVLPRYLVELKDFSQASILQTHISFNDSFYFVDSFTDICLGKNANLHYVQRQLVNNKSYIINFTNIKQAADSYLSSLVLDLGSKLTRNNLEINLQASGGQANLNGLYAVGNSQQIDNQSVVRHLAPYCLSNQLYKGVLEDDAKAVFKGKILVDKISQGTNAYQLNKNLMLGEKAQVYTKPQLEIFADDVKCTHGATVGQLDKNELFYLRTRGLSKKQSVQILTRGFIEDILDKISSINLKNRLKLFLEDNIKVLR